MAYDAEAQGLRGYLYTLRCYHIPPDCFTAQLVLKPAPHSRAIGCPRRGGDVIGKVTQPLAERKHSQALALARPVQEGVEHARNVLRIEDGMAVSFPGVY